MLQIPKIAPRTQEEYEYLINATVANSQEEYENAVETAKENALAQWEASVAAQPMTLEEGETAEDRAAKLEQEKNAAIQMAVASVPQPLTVEQAEATYGFYRAMFEQPAPADAMPDMVVASPDVYSAIYKVGDDYWNVAEAKWVSAPANASDVIELGGEPTVENLRESLLFYAKTDPRIQLGPEIMTEAEKFTRLRDERNARLEEYDRKIAQLDRLVRLYPADAATVSLLMNWDQYAQQLCALPEEEGAPWDGGGENTPWPEKPAA